MELGASDLWQPLPFGGACYQSVPDPLVFQVAQRRPAPFSDFPTYIKDLTLYSSHDIHNSYHKLNITSSKFGLTSNSSQYLGLYFHTDPTELLPSE